VSWAMMTTGPQREMPHRLEVIYDEIDEELEQLRERLLRPGDTSPGFRIEDLQERG
jgi:hypothetical protein